MATWKTVLTETTANNSNIANAASETFRISEASKKEMQRLGIPLGYNSISVVDTAGATSLTVRLNSGNNIQTLVLPSNGSVIVEPDDGEYWQEITIINNSGAQYNASSAFVNRQVKVYNGS